MIILDTNVVSEPLRKSPAPGVVAWLDAQMIETLALTSLTVAELHYGVATLPAGKRQQALWERLEGEILPQFSGRILGFDEPAAVAYGMLRSRARANGQSLGDFDALIASIAAANDVAVATRDTALFQAAGVQVINPFTADAS